MIDFCSQVKAQYGIHCAKPRFNDLGSVPGLPRAMPSAQTYRLQAHPGLQESSTLPKDKGSGVNVR